MKDPCIVRLDRRRRLNFTVTNWLALEKASGRPREEVGQRLIDAIDRKDDAQLAPYLMCALKAEDPSLTLEQTRKILGRMHSRKRTYKRLEAAFTQALWSLHENLAPALATLQDTASAVHGFNKALGRLNELVDLSIKQSKPVSPIPVIPRKIIH